MPNKKRRIRVDTEVPKPMEIKRLRGQHKFWKIEALATEAGVTEAQIKKAERGEPIGIPDLDKLARVFGVSRSVISSPKQYPTISNDQARSAAHPELNLFQMGHHTVQAIQLAGAGSEFIPRDRVHVTVDHSTYTLPPQIEEEREILIQKLEAEAKELNQKLWDGPNTRLLNFRVTALDGTERKHLYLTFGPIGWYDYSIVHRFLVPRLKESGTLEQFVDLQQASEGYIGGVRLTNICDTMTVLLTTDGFVLFIQRGLTVSVTRGMYSAISENIHPKWDRSLTEPDCNDSPFSAVRRGIEEEVSPELAKRIAPEAMLLLGLDFNLDFLHPDMLFAVAVSFTVDEVLNIAREFRGEDYFEGHLIPVLAKRDDPELDAFLSSDNWDLGGKACLVRAIQFIDAAEKKTGVPAPELIKELAAGNTALIEGDARRMTQHSREDKLAEKTYFNYRISCPLLNDSTELIEHLEARYNCEAIRLAGRPFAATALWTNASKVIRPDDILGELDLNETFLDRSPVLEPAEYTAARQFIKAKYEAGRIKHESREYRMISIDTTSGTPKINADVGRYYDCILTQYAIEWELNKVLLKGGRDAMQVLPKPGTLPLREAIERFGNPLYNGIGRCAALTASTLVVFKRRGTAGGYYCLIRRRSADVAVSPGMLDVVPGGMFEAWNREPWSLEMNIWRELLEELYSEDEQIGSGVPGELDYIRQKVPINLLLEMIDCGSAKLSVTGICIDLFNLRPEVCTVLLVTDPRFFEARPIQFNWEYESRNWDDKIAGMGVIRWQDVDQVLTDAVTSGGIAASAPACLSLGREWILRHGLK